MMAAQVLDSKAALRQRGTRASLPPEYAEGDYIELGGLSTPRTSTESLPAYDEAVSSQPLSAAAAAAGLRPTHTYQVESEGHPLLALPLAPRPSPIGVFAVQPDGSLGPLAVAQLVRSEALRTPGTSGATAGNGGRLLMDLGEWVGGKTEARAAEVLVLSSCLVMLKKEVDRRRAAQFMVLAGASGGP
ncbi:hypothetical protein MAA_07623 [Metarhizium robertsii ARSEF 23]|uniref:Uncharacterized protein n=1 Tax=Metarhizium robertsii (strain ARSEF 23 / ATCC MYA-3075) TaxID=655844 RepID=E9F5S4_METRA|nr:uncharacterized protein MAA_07623 [Metarhizium robertsii ARSEF 23]EFY96810.1 hypothetical protein MAA_07623 [Metarhizium robertsii ARSEF 23]